jgi:serine protease Do
MARSHSPLLLIATLLLGAILGIQLDRNARPLSAQAVRPAPAPVPVASPAEDVGPAPASPAPSIADRTRGEDGVYDQLARQYAQFEQVNRTFELVARAVSPSVVHLVAHKVGKAEEDATTHQFEETGSGVIVRGEKGRGLFVLTNNHVVTGTTIGQIDVFLSDGRSFHPSRIWADSKADIAVLKIERDDLPAARLGNSDDAPVGSWVMAMGSPFGLTHSVSQGIISGRGRHETDLEKQGVENQDFLQTDAAINPGNSGGPLVNMKGEIIGINIAILSNGGGSEGVGFSIPINLARWIMAQLINNGRVYRGALGVKLRPEFEPQHATAVGLDRPRGAWIESVDARSPAAIGGIRVGDVILKYNGVEVVDLNHLINLVSMTPIGQDAQVIVWRDRTSIPLQVRVADKERIAARDTSVLGVELVTLDLGSARRMGLPETLRGAAILKVEPDSPLASYFRPLDVIHAVSGRPVATADEVIAALGGRRTVELEFGIHRLVDGNFQRAKVRVP